MKRTTAVLYSAFLLSTVLAATPSPAAAVTLQDTQWGPFEIETGLDLTLAAGAGDTDAINDGLLADLDAFLDAEAITDTGLRWGARFRLRAQRDHGRSGFADSVGDCTDAAADCPVAGTILQRSLATGRYVSAPRPDEPGRTAVESAHLFVRGGWGEFRAGLTPGAAAMEAIPAVTAMRSLALDAGALDPGGHAAIRTVNDASGFGPRIAVQSQRIVGLRLSASFAAETRGCGVDVCVRGRQAVSVTGTPVTALAGNRLDNAAEIAVSFDHTFSRDTRIEAAVSLLTADPSDPAAPNGYTAVQAGMRVERGDWLFGASALDAESYSALSAGLARDFGPWRIAVEAGLSDDSRIHESQRAFQIGVSRLVGDHGLIGAALRREETGFALPGGPGQRQAGGRDDVSLLFETGLRY
ncbi:MULTISPECIES: porin [Hyphobacterium]|uniref:Porin n=1 Tax=Hyphobacterium vulgare TaxID=1736751 RepID=A0ABV6ZXS1_9PROT